MIMFKTNKTFWKNGKAHIITNFKGDEFHGLTKMFNVNGDNDYQFNYKHGFKEGVEKSWWSRNRLFIVSTYKKGRVNGLFVTFDY